MNATKQEYSLRQIQWYDIYATTSAALKLLLLRLTGRGPGRCVDFEEGMTMAEAPAFIQDSDLPDRVLGRSTSEGAGLCFLVSVGNREGVGEGGWGTRRADGAPGPLAAAAAVFRAAEPPANRGILLGGGATARLLLAAVVF